MFIVNYLCTSHLAHVGTGQVMGWGEKAIEVRSVQTGQLDGVFMHKRVQAFTFLCERNEKVYTHSNTILNAASRFAETTVSESESINLEPWHVISFECLV